MLAQSKLYLYAAGAALVAALASWGLYNKKRAERLKSEKEGLEATIHADRTVKKIKKEKKKELSLKESDIKEKTKDVKDPEDLDSLFNNDDW